MKLLSTILLFVAMLVGHGDGTEKGFSQQTIPDAVFERMQGRSYPVGCEINRSDLRYLRIKHYDLQGHVHEGELVCNKRIAGDLIDIFKELYRQKYPIERMRLIDDYDDHELSGDWKGHRELHILPDWLLIYYIQDDTLVLNLSRTGTHSNLFKK
jgi:addiction module RelE/StbE family toxin